jgi:homoprotocatechuate degradation regulator HpaR
MSDTEAPRLPPTSQSLPIVLLRARETVMTPIRKMLAKSDVSEQQWRILRVLAEHGPLDSSTVADKASLLFPSLTRTAAAMKDRGLITQRKDAADKRRQVLAITSAGLAVIEENREEALDVVRVFESRLGKRDYDKLLSLLHRLSEGD